MKQKLKKKLLANKMPKKYHKKPISQIKIAKARINFLFKLAKENHSLSDKYVKIARRIAMKYKIRLSSNLKKRFCKHCHKYSVPGVNCRVRLHKHRLIYYCLNCRHFMRHPVK
jgi:ribonuclease P protein subunit RPR2